MRIFPFTLKFSHVLAIHSLDLSDLPLIMDDMNGLDGLESILESLTGKKRASKSILENLHRLSDVELENIDNTCSICYDQYTKSTDLAPSGIEGYETTDPPIFLPVVETATYVTTADFCDPNADHYAVRLPCNHIFGNSCIREWLKNNVSCPLCRREVEEKRKTYMYKRAITETYVPVDWTCPLGRGEIRLSDPPLTMPVPGIGMSSGQRTGRDPDASGNSTGN